MQTALSIEELNLSFAIAGIAQIIAGNGGLPKLSITAPTASADIYLHGAQLTSWRPIGAEEVVFLSEHSHWEEGRAIRGGIPVCYPWFRAKADDLKAPAHGFVRTRSWRLESLEHVDDAVTVTMSTESDDPTKKWWPYDFHLLHRVTLATELKLELIVTNTGAAPFSFEEAQHTYFRVGGVEKVRVAGLDGVAFLDNTDSNRERVQHGEVVLSKQTDNAYLETGHALELIDPTLRRSIHIAKGNSRTTVVWNPWREGARSLADLGDDEWRQMICVETANILEDAVNLAPGERHSLTTTIQVADLR